LGALAAPSFFSEKWHGQFRKHADIGHKQPGGVSPSGVLQYDLGFGLKGVLVTVQGKNGWQAGKPTGCTGARLP
jgi:hypothetical protein